jgi:hypothetical protein
VDRHIPVRRENREKGDDMVDGVIEVQDNPIDRIDAADAAGLELPG